ncbi:putative purine permease 11 [Hibiscus syriacus]|uniref:Purine permease 11 n=1 Tax=Hibiscus syriacus TaxID=106335 RepID=A0A6A3CYM4_HIBSY|nr:putative purine permease 11 [Hibiscus syriacus]
MIGRRNSLMDQSPFLKLGRWHWWLLGSINILFLIVGQASAVLLGRFYYDQGGNSEWMATFVQTAGFPILFIPLFLLHPSRKLETSTSSSISPSIKVVALLYFALGLVAAAFNAVFSYFLNSEKMTALILNSVVILSLYAALIAVNDDSQVMSGVSKGKFIHHSWRLVSIASMFASGEWKGQQRKSFIRADTGLDRRKLAGMCCWGGGVDFRGVVALLQRDKYSVVGDYTFSFSDDAEARKMGSQSHTDDTEESHHAFIWLSWNMNLIVLF